MPVTKDQVQAITPQFWAAQVIGYLRANTVLAQLVRRNFDETEIKSEGQKVTIPKLGALTPRQKQPNVPITVDSPDSEGVDVELDQHWYCAWAIEDEAKAKAVARGLEYLSSAVPQLAEKVESVILALYASLSREVGVAGTDLDTDAILAAVLDLDTQKAPAMGRIFIVPPKDKVALLAEELFVHADKRGDAGAALRNASLGHVYGFDFFSSTLVPATAGPHYHGMALHPNALALVSRPMPIPEGMTGVKAALFPDPVTGLIVRVLEGYSITQLASVRVVDVLFGAALVDDRLAVEVLS